MSVTIRAVGRQVTERAIQIDLDGELYWLPKSQINSIDGLSPHAISRFTNDELKAFVVTDWIAREKGFTLAAEIYTVPENRVPIGGMMLHAVKAGDLSVCYSQDKRIADMIAAALNLTEGKR